MREKKAQKSLADIISIMASKVLSIGFFVVVAFVIGWLADDYNTRLTGKLGYDSFICCGSALLLGGMAILVDLTRINKK